MSHASAIIHSVTVDFADLSWLLPPDNPVASSGLLSLGDCSVVLATVGARQNPGTELNQLNQVCQNK